MGDVAGHDDGALQIDTGGDRILRQFLAHGVDALVEVYLDALGALTRLSEFLGNKLRGVGIHLLQPDAVAIDLGLDITVGRTADTHTDRTAGTVARQADDTDIMGQGLTAKLGSEANLMGFGEQFLLQVDIAEGATCLVARRGQRVIILDAGQLDGQQVLLGRRAADDEGNMIGRARCGAQRLHLLHQERQQGALILDGGLGHGVEIGLVGRAAALGHHDKTVFGALGGLDVNLCGQVAAGVHLVVHIQRSILRIAQVVLREGVVYATAQRLLVLKTSPYLLALLTVDDGRTRILAERQDTLGSHLCIAQELECHILIVLRSLGVFQNLGHLLVVLAAQHELHIVEGLLGQQRQRLLGHLDDFLAVKLGRCHAFFA